MEHPQQIEMTEGTFRSEGPCLHNRSFQPKDQTLKLSLASRCSLGELGHPDCPEHLLYMVVADLADECTGACITLWT
jgi:hypothetical protein